MGDKKKDNSLGACPFPPDGDPPLRSPLTQVLNYGDRFFRGWRNTLIVVAIASILFAYSLLAVTAPLAVSLMAPESWERDLPQIEKVPPSVHPELEYEDAIVIEENITLGDDEELVLEDDTYVIDGDIYLSGNAKLSLVNSTLYFRREFDRLELQQNDPLKLSLIFLNDSSKLEIVDSTISCSSGWYCLIRADYQTKIVCKSSNLSGGNNFNYIILNNDSSLELVDTSVDRVLVSENSRCTAIGSSVYRIFPDVHTLNAYDIMGETSVSLIDSKINDLVITVSQCDELILDNETLNLDDEWSSSSLIVAGKVYKVDLRNTKVKELQINVFNGSVEVTGENVLDVLVLRNSTASIHKADIYWIHIVGESEINLEGSVVTYLSISGSIDGCYIRDSKIERLSLTESTIDLYFNNTLIKYLGGFDSQGNIYGDLAFTKADQLNDLNSNFTVEYTVRTIDGTYVLPNVDLKLQNKDGEILWEGGSDENGKATFSLTYYKNMDNRNIGEECTLTASKGGITKTFTVKGFETRTCFDMELPIEAKSFPALPVSQEILMAISIITIVAVLGLKLKMS